MAGPAESKTPGMYRNFTREYREAPTPAKQPNEDLERSKEVAAERLLAKENAGLPNSCRTQSRE